MNTQSHSSFGQAANLDENAALLSLLEGTATATGEDFFTSLISALVAVLNTHGAWVTEYQANTGRMRALACRLGDAWRNGFEYDPVGTPCEQAIAARGLIFCPDNIDEQFPAGSGFINRTGAASYMGVPLLDVNGDVLGVLAVIDNRPMSRDPRGETVLRIFAGRAAAELRRLRAAAEVRQRELGMRSLINGLLDGIVELDAGLYVTGINPAGCRMLRCAAAQFTGRHASDLLAVDGVGKLQQYVAEIRNCPVAECHVTIAGGLVAQRGDGAGLDVNATLVGYRQRGNLCYTLVLRESGAYQYPAAAPVTQVSEAGNAAARIYTDEELQQFERDNIIRALEATGWRVSGDDGAAQLLGMNSSTLSSRIKTLSISRPG